MKSLLSALRAIVKIVEAVQLLTPFLQKLFAREAAATS